MPELPEVETIRSSLSTILVGKTVEHIVINEPKMVYGDPIVLKGTSVIGADRKGKVLIMILKSVLDHGVPVYLSIHLKLSGQILFAPNAASAQFKNNIPRADTNRMPGKTTRIILNFTDGSALYFNDLRKFGWMRIGTNPDLPSGPDVLSSDFSPSYLSGILKKTSRPIKTVLLDQKCMAGIGNIYANDSLWQAGILPMRKANTLDSAECASLFQAILKIIREAITHKGSSAKDELYILPDSTKGSYQNHFKTYHQQGKPCKRCGALILATKLGGRGTFYCPQCQH